MISKHSKKIVVLSWFFLTAASLPLREAKAWGEIGHASIGEIAERNLTPRAKAMVFSILGSEPLAVAANWPDSVRSDPRYKAFADYHFVTIPAGQKYNPTLRPSKDMYGLVLMALDKLARPEVSRDQKIILLRYLVHIIGDIHQPLHVGRPGDMGGNLCSVRIENPETGKVENENIHHVWDEVLIGFEKRDYLAKHTKNGRVPWFGYYEYTNDLLASPMMSNIRQVEGDAPVGATNFEAWLNDSVTLGDAAYPKVSGGTSRGRGPYCSWQNPQTFKVDSSGFDASRVPTLDAAYITRSLGVVRSQILFGGFRLAKVLNQLAEKIDAPAFGKVEQATFIREVTTPTAH